MAFVPPGFDQARILAGLHTAMQFGAPTRSDDKAKFYLVTESVPAGTPVDDEGVPFDPSVARARTRTAKTVDCAIETHGGGAITESFGSVQSEKITITLLDPEYQQVKGFAYVVVGGEQYFHTKTEPPVALGNIDVWTVHCSTTEVKR